MEQNQKVLVAVAITSLFASDVGEVERKRLDGFKAIIKEYSQDEIKTFIRLKTKEEKVAPFVFALVEHYKMLESSARNRHSNLRVLYSAWEKGFALDNENNYQIAIEHARDHLKGRQQEAKKVSQRNAKGAIIAEQIEALGNTPEALDVADAVWSTMQAKAEQDAKLAKVRKAAKEAGVYLLEGTDLGVIAAEIVSQFGEGDALTVASLVTKLVHDRQMERKAKDEEVAQMQGIAAQAKQDALGLPRKAAKGKAKQEA